MRGPRRALVLTTGLALLAAAACSAPKQHDSNNNNKNNDNSSLSLFMYQKPVGVFGPLAAPSGPDPEVNSLIYDTLMQIGPQGKLVPEAATAAPTVSSDGKTITYTLKPGLKWNDGQPLTSQDLVFTYTRAADSNTTSAWASYLTGVEGVSDYIAGKTKTISGFSAPNPTTFVIKQSAGDVGLPGRIGTIGIIPQHTL